MTGSIAFLQTAEDTTDASPYTFAAQNLGTAAGDRYIIVAVFARDTSSGQTLTGVTVGGVAATLIANNAVTDAASRTEITALAIAAVPTGTTGDIVCTFSAAMVRCCIAAYRATGLASATPSDTDMDTSIGEDVALTIDVPVNGFVLAVATSQHNSLTETWSGVTEDYALTSEASSRFTGGSLEYSSGSTGQAIACNFSSGTTAIGSAASWQFAGGGGAWWQFFFRNWKERWQEKNGVLRPRGYGRILKPVGMQI